MDMERETRWETPVWQVTPRLLVVTVAAAAIAFSYARLSWWANPSILTGVTGTVTAAFLAGWIISLCEPRRWPAGVTIACLLLGIGASAVGRTWVAAYASAVYAVIFWAISITGACAAAELLRFRHRRATLAVLTVLLCVGLGTLVVHAFMGFRLQVWRYTAAADSPVDQALGMAGVSPPPGLRWTITRPTWEKDSSMKFERNWRCNVPGAGTGKWETQVRSVNDGSPTAWRLRPFLVRASWRPDSPLPLLTNEEDVRRILRALAPGLQVAGVKLASPRQGLPLEATVALPPHPEWQKIGVILSPTDGFSFKAEGERYKRLGPH